MPKTISLMMDEQLRTAKQHALKGHITSCSYYSLLNCRWIGFET